MLSPAPSRKQLPRLSSLENTIVMLTKCATDNHYMSSPHFITLSLHSLSCIAVPLHVFGFYCILYKTPKPMTSVKWYLLNLHFWSVVLDVILTFFALPYAIFPAMAGYGLGPVNSPGLFIYLIITIINTVSLSIMLIFESRFHLLFAENTWWSKVRKPVLITNFILNPLYFLPPQFMIPEQETARELILKSLPCLPELPESRDLFVLSLDNTVPGVAVYLSSNIAAVQIGIFLFLNAYNLLNFKTTNRLSQRTIQMQKKLAIALFVQVLIYPVLSLYHFQSTASLIWFLFPSTLVIWIVKFDYHSQLVNNFLFVFVSTHGISSTIIMIIAHKPYREFTLGPVYRLLRKVPVILVTSSGSNTNIL